MIINIKSSSTSSSWSGIVISIIIIIQLIRCN